jgi:hypothetical protein
VDPEVIDRQALVARVKEEAAAAGVELPKSLNKRSGARTWAHRFVKRHGLHESRLGPQRYASRHTRETLLARVKTFWASWDKSWRLAQAAVAELEGCGAATKLLQVNADECCLRTRNPPRRELTSRPREADGYYPAECIPPWRMNSLWYLTSDPDWMFRPQVLLSVGKKRDGVAGRIAAAATDQADILRYEGPGFRAVDFERCLERFLKEKKELERLRGKALVVLLSFDAATIHGLADRMAERLEVNDVFTVMLPGGTTRWLQPLDVSGPFRSLQNLAGPSEVDGPETPAWWDRACQEQVAYCAEVCFAECGMSSPREPERYSCADTFLQSVFGIAPVWSGPRAVILVMERLARSSFLASSGALPSIYGEYFNLTSHRYGRKLKALIANTADGSDLSWSPSDSDEGSSTEAGASAASGAPRAAEESPTSEEEDGLTSDSSDDGAAPADD